MHLSFSNEVLNHLYGMINGIYIVIFMYVILFGLSYMNQRYKYKMAFLFFIVAFSFLFFGGFNVFFQKYSNAATVGVINDSLFSIAKFSAPIAVFLATYFYMKLTWVKSYKLYTLVFTYRWFFLALYMLDLAVFISLFYVDDDTAIKYILCMFVPHAWLAAIFTLIGLARNIWDRALGFMFLGVSIIASIYSWFACTESIPYGEPLMVSVHATLTVFVLLASFLSIRYGYEEIKRMLTVYTDEDHDLVGEIFKGIKNKHFFMVYQPKVTAQGTAVHSVEALIRWKHPKRGFIPPDRFIGLSESTGTIDLVCQYVIEQVVIQQKEWLNEGWVIRSSINFSPKNLNVENVIFLKEMLSQHGVDAKHILIEITESCFLDMDVQSDSMKAIDMLEEMGVELSLDDYGKGFSSLSYINRLPLSELKIDRSFIMDIDRSSSNKAIVDATIKMGQKLGLNIVAEGVENDDIAQFLRQLHCDILQGYGIAKPMNASEFKRWVEHSEYQIDQVKLA